jgi:ubiquinone biosynthesis protein Coq4
MTNIREILSISGYSGLFQYISQSRNGVIVEGVEDKKRMNAYSHYKVSSLGDIAIFTDDKEVPLKVVITTMKEQAQGQPFLADKPSDKQLKEAFATVLPNYDRERVYVSDIKKLFNWYNILQRNNMLEFTNDEETEAEANSTAEKTSVNE